MTAADVFAGDADWSVDVGDTREWVWSLPRDSVHCVVTSPPYYGLRDYGEQGQIGLEQTPDEYVAALVDVFRGVRRALHPTGVLWLNLGDSYANTGGHTSQGETSQRQGRSNVGEQMKMKGSVPPGFKQKDLMGIPWRVAFALQADGWFLRQWLPWCKRNPMPDSASDRPGTACETVFLLTKSANYYFDMEAVKRVSTQPGRVRDDRVGGNKHNATKHSAGSQYEGGDDRNFRSADLWFDSVGLLIADGQLLGLDVPTRPYKQAHFATFPPKLVEPLILAGSSQRGVCPHCHAPWVRVVEKQRVATRPGDDTKTTGDALTDGNRDPQRHVTKTRTVGWEPTCACENNTPVPAVVVDPFAGSGTTLMVARDRGRRAAGVELNPEYAAMARKRIGSATPDLF